MAAAVATVWSPAFPFGAPTRHPAPEVPRENIVRAIALLVQPLA
ncbi:hypothetical protein [Nonomuraea jabiensis]